MESHASNDAAGRDLGSTGASRRCPVDAARRALAGSDRGLHLSGPRPDHDWARMMRTLAQRISGARRVVVMAGLALGAGLATGRPFAREHGKPAGSSSGGVARSAVDSGGTAGNTGRAGKRRTAKRQTAPSPKAIRCECVILAYTPEFVYCDHDDVPEGSPSSIGAYPAFQIKLTKPVDQAGREVHLILRGMTFQNLSGSRGNHVGKRCALDLPADFLAGKFTRHLGSPDPRFKILK
jgi:hypothetical protein